MHYAVSIVNLMSLRELDPIGSLLFPKSILGDPVIPEKRLGTDAVVLTCNEDRAEAIVTLMRKKYEKYEFMMFKSKTGNGGWKRVEAKMKLGFPASMMKSVLLKMRCGVMTCGAFFVFRAFFAKLDNYGIM